MQRAVLAILALMWLAALVMYATNSGMFTIIEKKLEQLGEALRIPEQEQQSAMRDSGNTGLLRQVMTMLINVSNLVKRYTELTAELSKLNSSRIEELKKEVETYQRELEMYYRELLGILSTLNNTSLTVTPLNGTTVIDREKLIEELKKLEKRYLELYERLRELEKQLKGRG